MPLKTSRYIWHNGELVPWEQATVHVLTHALHYGSSVFEGVRVYKTPKGPVGFRLTDHIVRMYRSAKVYWLRIPFESGTIIEGCKQVILRNDLTEGAYIRPIAFRGYGEMGVAGNPGGQREGGFSWRDTTSARPHIDLDECIENNAGILGRLRRLLQTHL